MKTRNTESKADVSRTGTRRQIETRIVIEAPIERVWEVFTDFEAYPEWNPFVKKLEGQPVKGGKIKVVLPGMTFRPEVLCFESPKELRWKGRLLMKGLFDGEHYFRFMEHENGTTTLIHGEKFTGILVGMFRKMLDEKTAPGFEEMNRALRRRVLEG